MLNAMSIYEWFGWGLVTLGGALALWGLLRDRARGRARCPGCWYSMEAHTARLPATCPECGRVTKRANALYRTRRWWGVICVGGVMLLLGNVLFAVPRVKDYGALGAVPTMLLGWVAPMRPAEVRENSSSLRRSRVFADIEWQMFFRGYDGRVHAPAAWSWALSTRAWGMWDRWRGRSHVRVLDCGPAARACGVPVDELWDLWYMDHLGVYHLDQWLTDGGIKGPLGAVRRFVAFEVTDEEWGRIREVDDVLRARMPAEGVLHAPGMKEDIARILSLDDVMVTLEREPRTFAEVKGVVEAVTGMRVRVLGEGVMDALLHLRPGMLAAGEEVSVVRLLYAGVEGVMAETKPVWTARGNEVLVGPIDEMPRGVMAIDVDVYRRFRAALYEQQRIISDKFPVRWAEIDSALNLLGTRWWSDTLLGEGVEFDYGVMQGPPRGTELIGSRLILRGTACDFAEIEREISRVIEDVGW